MCIKFFFKNEFGISLRRWGRRQEIWRRRLKRRDTVTILVTASHHQWWKNSTLFYYFRKIKCAISKICIFLVNLQKKPWNVLFLSSYLYCFHRVKPKIVVLFISFSIDFTLGVVFFVFDLQVIFDEKQAWKLLQSFIDDSRMTI